MSIQLPESIPIPQAGLLELLGGGIGKGVSSALAQNAKLSNALALQDRKLQQQSLLQQIKEQNKQKLAQDKAATNFGTTFNKTLLNLGIDTKKMGADPAKLNLINQIGSERVRKGEDPSQVAQDLLGEFDPNLKVQQEQLAQGKTLSDMLSQYDQLKTEKRPTKFFDVEQAKHGPTMETKRSLVTDIQRLNKYMNDVEERQKQMSFVDKLKSTAMIGQNIASGLSLGVVPKKELPERYQHLQSASNFLNSVSEYVPLGGLLSSGKALGTKAMQKLFPYASKAAKVAGIFGAGAGGSVADTLKHTTETHELPSAFDVAKDFGKWMLFESVFTSLGEIKKLTPDVVNKFSEATGATKKEAAEYLKAKITPMPEEGPVKETAQKAQMAEKQTEKAAIGETQLQEQEKLQKKTVTALSKEPVEEIFKKEKEVKSRPETIAKEEARISDIEDRITPLRTQVKEAGSEIAGLQFELRNAETAEAKAKIQEKLDRAEYNRDELVGKIKDLQFEIRHKTKPKTHAELAEDIDTSIGTIKEDIKNAKEISEEKIKKDLEAHEKAIRKAEEILKRRRFLGEKEADYYTRLKQQYADAYNDIIAQNEKMIDSLEGKRTKIAQKLKSDLEKMNNILRERLKRANADIQIHKNKRAIQRLTKGARGAFYRKELAKLRGDVESLKENLFKQNKIKNQLETKTEEAFKEAPKSQHKIYSKEQAEAEAKNAGTSLNDIENETKKTFEKMEKESPKEQVETLKDFLEKANGKKILGSSIYVLNYLLKQLTGKGLPQRTLKYALGKSTAKIGYGIASLMPAVGMVIKQIKNANDRRHAQKLKSMSSIVERRRYIDELRKSGLSTRRINNIQKMIRS